MPGYDLLLQPPTPTDAFDPAPVEAALLTRGATRRGDGGLAWRVEREDVGVRRLIEGGRCLAVEVQVPFHERTHVLEAVAPLVFAAAGEAGVRVVDPQLGAPVQEGSLGSMLDAYRQASRYAGEMMGISSAVGASFSPPPSRLGAQTYWWALAVFLLAAAMGWLFGGR